MRLLAMGALLVLACGTERAAVQPLLVAAASDLAAAMPALVAAFEAETGVRVEVTLGSSGQIANQVLHGAPIDVFASADRGWIERLDAAGRLDPGSPRVYAYGRLVVLARPGAEPPRALEALRDAAIRRIAIANPEHAPYGRAAREALVGAGLWDELEPRIVIAENVRQAHQYAETGSVDVALTAWSLVDSAADAAARAAPRTDAPDARRWVLVPDALHTPLEQTIAVVAARPALEAARTFVNFMIGSAAREILARHNFVLPDAAGAAP